MATQRVKYAVQASCLQPKMSERETVDAIIQNYPLYVQRTFISTSTMQHALNFLKRLESTEESENSGRPSS